jgi:hypothetical protein
VSKVTPGTLKSRPSAVIVAACPAEAPGTCRSHALIAMAATAGPTSADQPDSARAILRAPALPWRTPAKALARAPFSWGDGEPLVDTVKAPVPDLMITPGAWAEEGLSDPAWGRQGSCAACSAGVGWRPAS